MVFATPSPELDEQAVLDNPLFKLKLHMLFREVRRGKMFIKVLNLFKSTL